MWAADRVAEGTLPRTGTTDVHFGHIFYRELILSCLPFPLLRIECSFTTIQAPTPAPKTLLFPTVGKEVL